MSINDLLIERFLRRLRISESAIRQFAQVSRLSSVDGRGFPRELFLLSAPMVARGLLNFAVLQMKRDWLFPFWVHSQLDPQNEAYTVRSQNPLMMNVTYRNWTALGSPSGYHEAIVDPRGLATPLPREWSLDTWLLCGDETLFPSHAVPREQDFDTQAPAVETRFAQKGVELHLTTFVATARRSLDVLFHRATVRNTSEKATRVSLALAIRPFNPEGVAPIDRIDVAGRVILVDKAVGVVLRENASRWIAGNEREGDSALLFQKGVHTVGRTSVTCGGGLANAAFVYDLELEAGTERSVDCSVALAKESELRAVQSTPTWRVSLDRRRAAQRALWNREQSLGATFEFSDARIQRVFDASKLSLLQFHDGDLITPGPFVYHHFWFRDAAVMLRALDVLGYSQRSRQVIEGFGKKQKGDGFFSGPDGEWDSNGAVLWTVHEHYRLTRSDLWLRRLWPMLKKGGQWIMRMRRKGEEKGSGLMPPSLSAEHLGMVDQYYWDSFWCAAGIRSLASLAESLNKPDDAISFRREFEDFRSDLLSSMATAQARLGQPVVPASPRRGFDESAIGSICAVYPLDLFPGAAGPVASTVYSLIERFCNSKGFLHPIIHSGYNPYLTLQLAHACLFLDNVEKAWSVAETIFAQANSPFSFPEAIHPKTGGGSMGDGHHGWAAAEIVLFLRDCLLDDRGEDLSFLRGLGPLLKKGQGLCVENAPTKFGTAGLKVEFETPQRILLTFRNVFHEKSRPKGLVVHLPFPVRRAVPVTGNPVMTESVPWRGTRLRLDSRVKTVFLEL